MNIRIFVIMLVLSLLYACTNNWDKRVVILNHNQINYDNLEEISTYEDIALKPSEILICDSLLILLDQTPDEKLKIFNINTSQMFSFVSQGRAKGEVLGAYDLDYIKETNEVAILDVTTSNILICSLDSIYIHNYHPKHTLDLKPSGFSLFTNIAINGTSVYCAGCFDECRLVQYNLAENKVVDSITYSPDTMDKIIDRYINQAYMGTIQYNKHANKIVTGCRYSDQLEIYDTQSKTVKFIKGPVLFEPDYEIVDIGVGQALSHAEDERKGYIDIASNNKYIYALYSGRTRQDGASSYGNEIRKFNWNGEYITTYLLEDDILSFDVDEGKYLYAISYSGSIIQYAFKAF